MILSYTVEPSIPVLPIYGKTSQLVCFAGSCSMHCAHVANISKKLRPFYIGTDQFSGCNGQHLVVQGE